MIYLKLQSWISGTRTGLRRLKKALFDTFIEPILISLQCKAPLIAPKRQLLAVCGNLM